MAEDQRVEYRIGKDGKITEQVIGVMGASCTQTTEAIEQSLGEVASRELLPEYYSDEEVLTELSTQSLSQQK